MQQQTQNNSIQTQKKEAKTVNRTQCDIYSRVMWYYRPVSHYNIWKKAEFYSRKFFQQLQNSNKEFLKKYK